MSSLADAGHSAVLTVYPPGAREVQGVALVLHGGRVQGLGAVRAHQLAVLRMRPFVSALRRDGAPAGLAVAALRYRVRGWNAAQQSPVGDTVDALDQLTARFPAVPIALVGHSMGGRAALYAAGHAGVQVVVGLAPWIEPGDPHQQLSGRRVLIVHGTRDRTTDPAASAAYARSADPVAASMTYVAVNKEGHGMLRRPNLWHRLASGFVVGALGGGSAPEPAGRLDRVTNLVTKALAGQATLAI